MNDSNLDWLRLELPALVRSGVLDEDAAARLTAHYALDADAGATAARWRKRTLAIFGALGAALIGGGIVLILAHNWDGLPRAVRIAFAIVPLLATQALAAWALARRAASAAWREAAGVSVVLAVATSIALVSQTYHVPGSLADFLFVTLLLASPVALLLDARLAAVLTWAGIALRALNMDFGSGTTPSLSNWLLVALSVPYLVLLVRRPGREWRLLAFVAAAALLVTGTATFFARTDDHGVVLYLGGMLALYAALGPTLASRHAWARPIAVAAGLGLPVYALVLTFYGPWEGLEHATRTFAASPAALVSIVVALVAGGCALYMTARNGERRAHAWLAAGALVPALAGYTVAHYGAAPLAQVLWNAWLAAFGLALTLRGVAERRFRVVNHGLVALAALAVARFFDTDMSFLARGVGFIVIGCAVLGVNALVARQREAA